MYAFMHRSGLHPGVKKWLYGITFLSFFVSNISLMLSGFLGPLSLVLQPETTYWNCAAIVGRQREKKETTLRGEEGFSSSGFCLLHFSVPAAFCCHCGIVSGLGSERMKKREGGDPRDFFYSRSFRSAFSHSFVRTKQFLLYLSASTVLIFWFHT